MNLTFVTSVTLKIKVATPKQISFLWGLWRSYIPGFELIAVNLFKLSHGIGVFGQTDGQMDRGTDRQMDEQMDSTMT